MREGRRSAKPIGTPTRTNVVSVLAARPLGIPVIVSERNNPALQYPGMLWSALRRYAYARAHGL
ncbi:hypothetical protein TomMM35A_25490 [Sphingobium sp. TomMM35A]